MEFLDAKSFGDLRIEGHEVKQGIKKQAQQVIREVRKWAGEGADIQVRIAPETAKKRAHLVRLKIDGYEEPIEVKKRGRNLISVLKKVKRIALRKLGQAQPKSLRRGPMEMAS